MANSNIAQLFDVNGKSAIITGGALGIGQAIALRLAEAGAAIMIADVNLEAANATVEHIKSLGGMAQAVLADARQRHRFRAGRSDDPRYLRPHRYSGQQCGHLSFLPCNPNDRRIVG